MLKELGDQLWYSLNPTLIWILSLTDGQLPSAGDTHPVLILL